MATSSTTRLKMKLLIDTSENRVLFAEANKDVVDFLFSLLALPLATTIGMFGIPTATSMRGSVGNLYASVWDFDSDYILPGVDKEAVLRPTVLPSVASTSRSSLILLPRAAPWSSPQLFICWNRCSNYVTDRCGTTACPICGHKMTRGVQFIHGSGSGEDNVQEASMISSNGFVREAATYTVTDDLTVTPMSNISSITLFRTLGVTDFSVLQEKTVWIGRNEGLQILQASLLSKTVLTDVFLSKKA